MLCQQAIAWHMQGSAAKAREALERALELAGEEGWVRIFVDFGPPMRHLLERGAASGSGGPAVVQLLTAFESAEPVASTPVPPLAEPIRERELQVLRSIASGLSNPEIAAQLNLSPNTVKTHVRNLYAKLGARKRSEALRRARDLGLING